MKKLNENNTDYFYEVTMELPCLVDVIVSSDRPLDNRKIKGILSSSLVQNEEYTGDILGINFDEEFLSYGGTVIDIQSIEIEDRINKFESIEDYM